jgi:hypothetical protein
MPATVFFSWQADTPNRTGRGFIHHVLERACKALQADSELTEAARDLAVDTDTQGAPGSPPIVATIFKKIDAASVFVADMTFVAQRADGGRSPNPNVLIEYGWALRALGHERVICIMNTAYGHPSGEALPFDLRHAKWPYRYDLAEDASEEQKAKARAVLAKEIAAAVRACLHAAAAASGAERMALADLRAGAVAAGWNGDVNAVNVGDNDWWSFCKRLRQAAADGSVAFFGRRYVYDFGRDSDSEPLIPIPPAHFADFEFDIIELARADNYDIFTGQLGQSRQSLKGSIYRDLHVDQKQVLAWLEAEGKSPAPADMTVRVAQSGPQLGDFTPVATLFIKNIGRQAFEHCLVEMIECTGIVSKTLPMPLAMRTQEQIRANTRGRFLLSAGQEMPIPLAFYRPQRANEWYFVDDAGKQHFFSANPTKILIRIVGGTSPGHALVYIDTDAGWRPHPSVRTVPSDFSLSSKTEIHG